MSLNDLFFNAKSEYQTYLYTSNIHFKNEAQKYYNEYKKQGGKRKFKKLEKYNCEGER